MFVQKFLISMLIAGCCAIPASASSLVTYTSSSAFAAATVGDDPLSNLVVTAGGLGTSFTDLGVNFSDPDQLQGITDLGGWPAGTAISDYSGDFAAISITIPSTVNAIGFYVSGGGVNISVTDSTGGAYLNMPLASGFFGVATDSTFVTFDISAASGQLVLGDIMVGTADAAPTPEAATLLLVGTGLFMMGYLRRRMPRRVALQAASRGTVCTMSTGITPA
jgi:hypothetical protein